ncbi:Aquaporin-2 [Drechslerella dactyloides]|uniref:Aquaporin-2 n=1 Tax=Drechslerella dactyloides TaxID=74499 RepID=A0AAD6NME4_DREDA|nr:Aquaporin-2 [Drechslerella dactyloides]
MPTWERTGLSSGMKNHLVAASGEFIGTFMFLFMSYSVVQIAGSRVHYARQAGTPANGGADPALIFYIASAFGMSLAVNVWIFYRVSGGMFNPAVTLALVLGCGMPIVRAVICVVSQIIASICAAAVASAMLPGKLSVGTSTAGSGISEAQGCFLEMFLTAQLIVPIFFLAVEKHRATFLAPLGIGGGLFVGHLVGIYYTGAGINPARSFGPAVVTGDFNHDHWIYWIGPILGAIISAGLYRFMKFMEYTGGNPDQDIDLTSGPSHMMIDGKDVNQREWARNRESDPELGGSIPAKNSPVPVVSGGDDIARGSETR